MRNVFIIGLCLCIVATMLGCFSKSGESWNSTDDLTTGNPDNSKDKPHENQSSSSDNPSSMKQETSSTSLNKSTKPTDSSASKVKMSTDFIRLASSVQSDMYKNFWYGNDQTGHIVKESRGHAIDEKNAQEMIWAHATMIFEMETYYRATGDVSTRKRLVAEWEFLKKNFTRAQLTGDFGSAPNIAIDDTGWGAMAYMACYRATGDIDALRYTGDLIYNAYVQWMAGELSNGIYYNNTRTDGSMAAVGVLCAALDFCQAVSSMNDKELLLLRDDVLDMSMELYQWMETTMLRDGNHQYANGTIITKADDNLYWMTYRYANSAPEGYDREYDIKEAGSISALFANMAMGVAHARLYALTGMDIYRIRAVRTAVAITNSPFYNKSGVLVNDRDAWANGSFAGDYVNKVLTLRGIRDKDIQLIGTTTESILKKCRTESGYYKAEWGGGLKWTNATKFLSDPTVPEQIMTSANTANMVMAAALAQKLNLILYQQ